MKDLNSLYRSSEALHKYDFNWEGFYWIDCHDADQSVLAFARRSENKTLLVVVNFTPVTRQGYRIGVPVGGSYKEVLNSDSSLYGGSNAGNGDSALVAEEIPWMNQSHSLSLTLPPLGCIVLAPQ